MQKLKGVVDRRFTLAGAAKNKAPRYLGNLDSEICPTCHQHTSPNCPLKDTAKPGKSNKERSSSGHFPSDPRLHHYQAHLAVANAEISSLRDANDRLKSHQERAEQTRNLYHHEKAYTDYLEARVTELEGENETLEDVVGRDIRDQFRNVLKSKPPNFQSDDDPQPDDARLSPKPEGCAMPSGSGAEGPEDFWLADENDAASPTVLANLEKENRAFAALIGRLLVEAKVRENRNQRLAAEIRRLKSTRAELRNSREDEPVLTHTVHL